VIFLFLTVTPALAQEWKVYPYVPEGSLISFPADEGRHAGEAMEWWYMAGHLKGESTGTAYSFMVSYFYYPATIQGFEFDGFRILNLANDDTGEFFSETQPVSGYLDLATDHLHLDVRLFNQVRESWVHRESPEGTRIPFEYEVSASSEHGALVLSTVLQKRPLIPGGDGLFDQGASSYTYYYSLTDNLVTGTLHFNGNTEEVSGHAWIDRQYGSFDPNTREKYEWFYLQLSNGMDLNIWNLFTSGNLLPHQEAYRHLSVYVDENTQYTEHDFSLERLAYSCLPGSGNCYAQQWRLTSEINQLDLLISTLHHHSEVELPFYFFEGAVEVSGTVNGAAVTGKGFAELIKTYEAPQLNIVAPGSEWHQSEPITWMVEDPDQGRPVLFDLAYSTAQGNTWLPVAEELSDTFYYWNDTPLMLGDSCLWMVTGYTPDRALEGVFVSPVFSVYVDQATLASGRSVPGFHVYPNPVAQSLGIRWEKDPSASGKISYLIFDYSGRQALSGILSDNSINLSTLTEGIYLIMLQTPEGAITKTFVKQ
jgi:predicted secreted hydrolase